MHSCIIYTSCFEIFLHGSCIHSCIIYTSCFEIFLHRSCIHSCTAAQYTRTDASCFKIVLHRGCTHSCKAVNCTSAKLSTAQMPSCQRHSYTLFQALGPSAYSICLIISNLIIDNGVEWKHLEKSICSSAVATITVTLTYTV